MRKRKGRPDREKDTEKERTAEGGRDQESPQRVSGDRVSENRSQWGRANRRDGEAEAGKRGKVGAELGETWRDRTRARGRESW